MTNAEARFNKSLHPRKPEGSLGRTAQDFHLGSHTAPELWYWRVIDVRFYASVVEDLSGVDVDDMLQMRKKNNKHFCFVLFFV